MFMPEQKPNSKNKKSGVLIACGVTVGAIFVLGLIASTNSAKRDDVSIQSSAPESLVSTTEELEESFQYAEDELINKFINEYNAIAKYQMQDISKGNIRTKYHCSANDCWIEMINATEAAAEAFTISINAGNSEGSGEKAFAVFSDMAKVFDPELTDEKVSSAIALMENGEKYDLSDEFTVVYSPSVEVSWGKTDYKIEITAKNYN